ncbi:MAG: hypothetical protein KJ944_04865 [Alphaproteobacteria bacterium]|nr:hypothetical protein [Alphaproteobacteria bacterium]MBU1560707.1 hypothetical protein [Alphaproteobacteria bacterium]MBU2301909.1 hypothetical protein [Alphaproteobacteria bacterium]MBU2368959.1 hypothetical protein [Alphaproteobacteria bacterium]
MNRQPKIEAQRQGSNLFAFRRLKWGDPPQRFRVDHALGDPKNLKWKKQADTAVTRPSEHENYPSIVNLNQRREWERLIDFAVWAIALIAVFSLAYTVVL